MVTGSLAPQAAHRRPGVAGFLVLVLVVHIAHALCLSAGALVLGAFVFLVERLAASLQYYYFSSEGKLPLRHGGRANMLMLDGSVRSGGIDKAALFPELLGHATHLPSFAIPRWHGTPRRFP